MAEDTAEQTAAEPPRTVVYLGNRKPFSMDTGERVTHTGKFCTTVSIPATRTLLEAVNDIVGGNGIWANMSAAAAPAWVAAEGPLGPALGALLSAHYQCELRDPEPAGGEG